VNRTGVEWAQFSWNPITGCLNGCEYCYAARMAKRLHGRAGYPDVGPFAPTLHSDRLQEPARLRRPSRIFLESMGELWGHWVSEEWQKAILEVVKENPRHVFLNPTKSPEGVLVHVGYPYYPLKKLPDNLWLGQSLDTVDRVKYIGPLRATEHKNLFLSCEPLLEDITTSPYWDLRGIGWVIIGAQTGPGAKPVNCAAVAHIFAAARAAGIPLFIKDNVGMPNPPQEFPASFPRGRVA
jgi:protein gp37